MFFFVYESLPLGLRKYQAWHTWYAVPTFRGPLDNQAPRTAINTIRTFYTLAVAQQYDEVMQSAPSTLSAFSRETSKYLDQPSLHSVVKHQNT